MPRDRDEQATRSTDRSATYRRAFDLVASGVLAVLTLPVVVIAAIGSAIALRAWPFFVQERIGRDGETFHFLKIRTLPPSVPADIDKYALRDFSTPLFCGLLRRFHLDELPQLYLVITGHMSLVGPRPEIRSLHARMPQLFAAQRTSIRPGCTGLWQISRGSGGLIHQAPEYDRFYLANRSLRLDMWILFRTALNMTGLATRCTLDDVPAVTLPPLELATRRVTDLQLDRGTELDLLVPPRRTTEALATAPASTGR